MFTRNNFGTNFFAQSEIRCVFGSKGSSTLNWLQAIRSGNGKLAFTGGPMFRYQPPPGKSITTGMHPTKTAWNNRIRKVLSPGITGQNSALRISSAQMTSEGKLGEPPFLTFSPWLPCSRLETANKCGKRRCHFSSSPSTSALKGRSATPSAMKSKRSFEANSQRPNDGRSSVIVGGVMRGPKADPSLPQGDGP